MRCSKTSLLKLPIIFYGTSLQECGIEISPPHPLTANIKINNSNDNNNYIENIDDDDDDEDLLKHGCLID